MFLKKKKQICKINKELTLIYVIVTGKIIDREIKYVYTYNYRN